MFILVKINKKQNQKKGPEKTPVERGERERRQQVRIRKNNNCSGAMQNNN